MEIIPGIGAASVRIGEPRADVEGRIGQPDVVQGTSCHYDDMQPALVVDYTESGTVELLQMPFAGSPGHEVTWDGIQLTYRAMDDVVADLEARGLTSKASDIGHEYPTGFAIWSMGSLMLPEVDPSVSDDDERLVVEGVSVAEPAYFGF